MRERCAARERIAEDIGDDPAVVEGTGDGTAPEAVSEDVAGAAPACRVTDEAGVCGFEPEHGVGEQAAGILDEQVEVVCHQAEGVDADAGVEADGGEDRQENQPVDGRGEESRAVDAAIRHVVETIGGRSLGPMAIPGKSRHAP